MSKGTLKMAGRNVPVGKVDKYFRQNVLGIDVGTLSRDGDCPVDMILRHESGRYSLRARDAYCRASSVDRIADRIKRASDDRRSVQHRDEAEELHCRVGYNNWLRRLSGDDERRVAGFAAFDAAEDDALAMSDVEFGAMADAAVMMMS